MQNVSIYSYIFFLFVCRQHSRSCQGPRCRLVLPGPVSSMDEPSDSWSSQVPVIWVSDNDGGDSMRPMMNVSLLVSSRRALFWLRKIDPCSRLYSSGSGSNALGRYDIFCAANLGVCSPIAGDRVWAGASSISTNVTSCGPNPGILLIRFAREPWSWLGAPVPRLRSLCVKPLIFHRRRSGRMVARLAAEMAIPGSTSVQIIASVPASSEVVL